MSIDDCDAWEARREKQGANVFYMPILLIRDSLGGVSLHGLIIEFAPYRYPEGQFVKIGVFGFSLEARKQRAVEEFRLKIEERQKRRTIVLV
jgi:hypothetical protein